MRKGPYFYGGDGAGEERRRKGRVLLLTEGKEGARGGKEKVGREGKGRGLTTQKKISGAATALEGLYFC